MHACLCVLCILSVCVHSSQFHSSTELPLAEGRVFVSLRIQTPANAFPGHKKKQGEVESDKKE